MKQSKPNAFRRDAGREVFRPRGLAELLAPMRAALHESPFGFRLELEPMRIIDALVPWTDLSRSESAATLLSGQATRPTGSDSDSSASSLATLAARLAIPVLEDLEADQLVLADDPLRELVALAQIDDMHLVLVEGLLDERDARAIRRAVAANQSALEVELRAVAAMWPVHDRAVIIETRTRRQAAAFVAENFRQYLAALRNQPAGGFAAPEIGLVDSLLDRTGNMTIRPIETEVFSTSIDVGINTSAAGEIRPADASLIYDRCSNTWHGD